VADPGIEGVHRELHALLLELPTSLTDIRDAHRKDSAVHREGDRQVAGLVLDPAFTGGVRVPRQPERLAVERIRPRQIFHRHSDEVDALCSDQPTEPSIWS
jgi:hypothetical protein